MGVELMRETDEVKALEERLGHYMLSIESCPANNKSFLC